MLLLKSIKKHLKSKTVEARKKTPNVAKHL